MTRRRRVKLVRNPEHADHLPYDEWIPAHAVKFNSDGTTTLMTEGSGHHHNRARNRRQSNLGELDTPWAKEYIRKARDWGEESALAGDDLNRRQFERDTKAHKYHYVDYDDSRDAAWSAFQEGFAEAQRMEY